MPGVRSLCGDPVRFCHHFLNLRGIRTRPRSNELLITVMVVVIGNVHRNLRSLYFSGQGWSGLFSYKPFYNPETFNFGAVMTATSFAALTYRIRWVTTLAEDVKDPDVNMLLAPYWVCLLPGFSADFRSTLPAGMARLFFFPQSWKPHFYDVCSRWEGTFLFNAVAIILFIACLGSGLAGR